MQWKKRHENLWESGMTLQRLGALYEQKLEESNEWKKQIEMQMLNKANEKA